VTDGPLTHTLIVSLRALSVSSAPSPLLLPGLTCRDCFRRCVCVCVCVASH
jgi:hypothetical protein